MPAGQAAGTIVETSSCSGASTMYVAPNRVSGRVVKTVILADPIGKSTCAPWERPIQLRCISLTGSGQSSVSRSSTRRSPYWVMRIIHCFRLRLKTGKLPRSERPSGVTSSLDSTVPRPGHQLTGASLMYARRWSSITLRRSVADRPAHSGPRSPASNEAISSLIGRALFTDGSNQELKTCRKIHWVQR